MEVLHTEPKVAGYVHFVRSVPVDALTALLPMIKTLGVDSCWIDLHVRAAGDDGTHVIQMTYQLDREGKRTQRKFTSRILQFIKNEFGTEMILNREVIKSVKHWSFSTIEATA